ncbi:unnamed protein product [Musa acuminata var. zebrina]
MSTPLPEHGDIPRGQATQAGAATSANDSVNPTDISLPQSDILEPRQSPPVQVMEKSDPADPNRIPSSIFERSKSTTPMEWSVASNESLFSIHVGNSSFSKENVASPMASYSVHAESGALQAAAEAANAEEHAHKERRRAEQAALPPSLSRSSAESFAFPILTGERKSGSFKGEPGHPLQPDKAEQLPLQTGTPKEAPAAGESRWFSCFSCCTSCC